MAELTADLCARAVIAAARVYGDDPVLACTAKGGHRRRAIAPAVLALAGVLHLSLRQVARIFGMRGDNVGRLAGRSARFLEAQAAAEGAVMAWSEPLETAGQPAPPPAAPPPAASEGPERLTRTRMLAPRRVQAEVLACLADEPCTGPELMQLVGVGEGQVREALAALKAAGRVTSDPLTQEGWRAQFWRLSEGGE
jgi:hypothetical protein